MKILNEIEAALAAATPGEWEQIGYDDIGRVIRTLDRGEIAHMKYGKFKDMSKSEYRANAHLIALLKNNAPALIEAVKLLKEAYECGERMENGHRVKELLEKLQ